MKNQKNSSNENYTLYWWISEILVMGLFIAVLSLFNTDTCAVSYCDKQPSFGSDYCSTHKYRDNSSYKYSTYSNSKKNNSSGYNKKNSSSDYYNKKQYKNANDFADYWAEDFEEDDYDSLEDAWDDAYDYWND